MVDRMLAIIIIFLSVSAVMAAILAMGAVPQIFKSAEKIRETQQLVNQTQMTLYEDQARMKQTLHEDQAREKQVQQILNQVKTIVTASNKDLQNYIDKQNNTTNKLLLNQETVMKQHDQVSKDHNNITELVNNLTLDNNEMLKKFGSENNAMQRSMLEAQGKDPNKVINEYLEKHPQYKPLETK